MFRATVLIAFLILFAAPALAEDKKESMSDCKFWNTKMVMSTTSKAKGHVISGRLDGQSCQYDVRFYMAGQLLMVKSMRDYELVWAPKASEKRKPSVQKSPEDYLGDLEFGG